MTDEAFHQHLMEMAEARKRLLAEVGLAWAWRNTMADIQRWPETVDCTGHIDEQTGTLQHDGETCPLHERCR